MIRITKQLPRMVQPLSVLRYRGMMSKQMHQSPVVSLFRKNKKVEKVISGGSSVGGGVGDGLSGSVSHNQVSNGNENMSVEKHPILKRMPRMHVYHILKILSMHRYRTSQHF